MIEKQSTSKLQTGGADVSGWAIRRIGALLEQDGLPEPLLKKLERGLARSASLISWVPNRPRRGKTSQRWGVVLNG